MDNSTPFRTFGTMLDCSRNAVPNLHALKKWVDLTASLGYNTLLLYTEDTYEVPDEPYFGYMRGRYSQAELRELDAYAKTGHDDHALHPDAGASVRHQALAGILAAF